MVDLLRPQGNSTVTARFTGFALRNFPPTNSYVVCTPSSSLVARNLPNMYDENRKKGSNVAQSERSEVHESTGLKLCFLSAAYYFFFFGIL